MDTRRDFLKKMALLSSSAWCQSLISPIARAVSLGSPSGSSFLDAEHIVILMQENRSFDHMYGTLAGVRGFRDPRAVPLPNQLPVWLQQDEKGNGYIPFHLDSKNTRSMWTGSLPHSWPNYTDARNEGAYDRWLLAKKSSQESLKDIPMTLGFYTREDLPFYYALADAFTVCDHYFCSSLTGTTPNRLHLWTGTIRDPLWGKKRTAVYNRDVDYGSEASWKTFPERLEEAGVSWKVYQNELSLPSGLTSEEDDWLANFTDNPLEWFKQYNVRCRYNLDALSERERRLHRKAFTCNEEDVNYRKLEPYTFSVDGVEVTLNLPRGDLLHQFRKDALSGQLPTVSWLVAPANVSEHPSSPMYGSWYTSEVMNILTTKPELWRKTIFIINYDENDGYFDHIPPFVPPHPEHARTGKWSHGLDPRDEFVFASDERLYREAKDVREGPIGLGFRVPAIIASPWSRGGCVSSEVFDHTSVLQFLEVFLEKKTGKKVHEENISAWRRAVCGDLTSVFQKDGEVRAPELTYLERNHVIEEVKGMELKSTPSPQQRWSKEELQVLSDDIRRRGREAILSELNLPEQEAGRRPSAPLPVRARVWVRTRAHVRELIFQSIRTKSHGKGGAGLPYIVYAWDDKGALNIRNYTVLTGDLLHDEFDAGAEQLEVFGPQGFYRLIPRGVELPIVADCEDALSEVKIVVQNCSLESSHIVRVTDEYTHKSYEFTLTPPNKLLLPLALHDQWYDLTVEILGGEAKWRFAGRVETGEWSWTDPHLS